MYAVFPILRTLIAVALVLLVPVLAAASDATVSGFRIGKHALKTRIVLDLSHRIKFETFVLSDPYRVVIDLPEVAWQLPASRRRTTGVVSAFRYGLFEQGRSRIVIDVRKPVKVGNAFILPPGGNRGHRLVIDLVHTSRGELLSTRREIKARAVARRSTPAPTAKPTKPQLTKPQLTKPKTSKTVIVIDPGHGGVDPGTIGPNGTWEKNIALAYARTLRRKLLATGRYQVTLTRNRDVFLSLRRRISIARARGADLFVSLHADSIANPKLRGAHVYTLSEGASDAEAAALAAKENKSDLIAGVDLSGQSDDVTNILIDLAQRETMNQSAIFARTLIGELRRTTKVIRKSHRFAGFVVLKSPDVPSILVELGYLSNPIEERLLRQKKHRERMAGAIVRGIDRYFARQQAYRRP